MRPVPGFLSLALLTMIAPPVMAQTHDSTDLERREAAVVLDHTFTSNIGEPTRVYLAKGVIYRAEMAAGGLQLQLKPLMGSTERPLVQPLLAGRGAGGSSTYIITPRTDAVYVFTTLGGDATRPVKLRVYAMPAKGVKAE